MTAEPGAIRTDLDAVGVADTFKSPGSSTPCSFWVAAFASTRPTAPPTFAPFSTAHTTPSKVTRTCLSEGDTLGERRKRWSRTRGEAPSHHLRRPTGARGVTPRGAQAPRADGVTGRGSVAAVGVVPGQPARGRTGVVDATERGQVLPRGQAQRGQPRRGVQVQRGGGAVRPVHALRPRQRRHDR